MDKSAFSTNYRALITDPDQIRFRHDDPIQDLTAILERCDGTLSRDQRAELSARMGMMGEFYGAMGAIQCLDGDEQGWKLLKRCWMYLYWDARITSRLGDFWAIRHPNEKRSWTEACFLAPMAAFGLAIARDEVEWVFTTLEEGAANGRIGWNAWDGFSVYLVQLFRMLQHRDDLPPIELEPYSLPRSLPFMDLLDAWNDEGQLAQAIHRTCDYHLQWNDEDEDTDEEFHYAEFSSPFAIVNPVEIHALRAVRNELDLAMPAVEHELLRPPFYPAPEFVSQMTTEEILAEDTLLRRIVELNRDWCDGKE